MKKLVRTALSALAATLVTVTATAQSKPQIFRITSSQGVMQMTAMSDNGKYAISVTSGETDVDNPQPAGGTLINLDTRKTQPIDAPTGVASVNDVADNGVVVGSSAGKPGYWSPETKEWKTFSLPRFDPLYIAGWTTGDFLAVTPDAKYAVGYFMQADNPFEVMPMAYDLTTGSRVALNNLPPVDLEGEDKRQNVFVGISPDGRYALGQMSQSYLMPVALFSYIYDLQEQTWTPIGYDYNASTKRFTTTYPNLHYIDHQKFSCDGKWVTGTAYMVENGGDMGGGTEYWAPYRYRVDDNTLEVFSDTASRNLAGNSITAEGDMLVSGPHGSSYPTAYIRSGKYFISLDQTLRQVYGIDLARYNEDGISGAFECLSVDGLTAIMRTYDNCYVIKMNEPFVDAASKVDLLANYTVSIPDGTTMSKLGELKITFDQAISCKNMPSTIKLKGSNGTSFNASATSIAADNNHQFVLTFRTRTLEAGVTYTVEIPAEYITMAGDPTIKSKAITLTYKGRGNNAVKPRRITPADGSSISEFNSSNDVITIVYDSQIQLSTDATVRLFVEGDNNPIANFYGSANGNTAVFFPASTYYLYEGSEYRVVISQGAVTDLSGGGASDAIVLHYKGVYRRQISDSDIYLLNENCDSYNTFLFYDGAGDRNAPGETAEDWGFSSDNNAWILTCDTVDSTDMAMTTHSMFAESGTADAWLVTPQLYMPDEKVYLAFDAQSYLRSKADVLKVYVYVCDAVYNYMNSEIADAILADGDLIIDTQLTPGEREETLAGDWQHFTYPLDKYAGKNIYIAFVNRNTDQSAIFLNDIQVVRDLNFVVTNQTPERVVNRDEVTVKGIVTIANEINTFKGITVKLLDKDGNLLDQMKDDNVNLAYKDMFNYQFNKPLALAEGEETKYVIEVVSGEVDGKFNYSVKNLTFEPMKKIVLEEFTGSECGNCPLGINAIERLERQYPNNFIPVTLRCYSGDYYSNGVLGYASGLSLNAAPTGRVNRGPIISPAFFNGANYAYEGNGVIDSAGDEVYVWADAVRDEIEKPADASIQLSVNYDSATGELTVPCSVRFALNMTDRPVRIFAAVLEDNIFTYQVNYFNQTADPALGDWGKGGIYGDATVYTTFNDVTRYVFSSNVNGEILPITQFEAGKSYQHTLKANVPSSRFDDESGESCKVVVMLIDGTDNSLINANVARFGQSGIEGIVSDSDPSLNIDAEGSTIVVGASSEVTAAAYAVDGRELGRAYGNGEARIDLKGYTGVVIVKASTANGTAAGKLILK